MCVYLCVCVPKIDICEHFKTNFIKLFQLRPDVIEKYNLFGYLHKF